jgi:hypothetical protein
MVGLAMASSLRPLARSSLAWQVPRGAGLFCASIVRHRLIGGLQLGLGGGDGFTGAIGLARHGRIGQARARAVALRAIIFDLVNMPCPFGLPVETSRQNRSQPALFHEHFTVLVVFLVHVLGQARQKSGEQFQMDVTTGFSQASWRPTGPAHGRAGRWPPLVLVHGLFSTAQINWVKYGHAARLADAGFRLFMPDLRAHGQSSAPHDPASYPEDVLVKTC